MLRVLHCYRPNAVGGLELQSRSRKDGIGITSKYMVMHSNAVLTKYVNTHFIAPKPFTTLTIPLMLVLSVLPTG